MHFCELPNIWATKLATLMPSRHLLSCTCKLQPREANGSLLPKHFSGNSDHKMTLFEIEVNPILGQKRFFNKCLFVFRPALKRKNLHVLLNARASRVLFDKYNRAYGVAFERRVLLKTQKYVALASREVVLSAGTVVSPQILMLSGIGPAYHLKSLGVPNIVVDNPAVGQNLQSQVVCYTHKSLINVPVPVMIIKRTH